MTELSSDEAAALEAAQAAGWLLASGRRIAVLVAFKSWCARSGRPCVVARAGARDGQVLVNDRLAWRGPVAALEQTAAGMAQEAAQQPRGASGRCQVGG